MIEVFVEVCVEVRCDVMKRGVMKGGVMCLLMGTPRLCLTAYNFPPSHTVCYVPLSTHTELD